MVPKMLLVSLLLISLQQMVSSQSLNATELDKFVDELSHVPVIHAFDSGDRPVNLTIGMYAIEWKFHRDLPSTKVFAYGMSKKEASIPGPTIEARHGVPLQVTWENNLPDKHILPVDHTITTATPRKGGIPTAVHVHGGLNEPHSDGHSMAWFTSGFKERGSEWSRKTYYYHNAQGPANLWYHDHAMGLTRTNILAGLSGAYVIRQPEVESQMNLPTGANFDRVLMISDRDFNKDGSIYMNPKGNNPKIHPQWQPEYFGSVVTVNGKAWPYLRVQPRRYRFRIINSSNARFYHLWLTALTSNTSLVKFTQIGSDAFYLPRPVHIRSITLAPSEIHDVVIDFAGLSGELLLRNTAPYPFPSGDPVSENQAFVMKFIIESPKNFKPERKYTIPHRLVPHQRLLVKDSVKTRTINLYEFVSKIDEPTHLYINAVPFDAPATETPKSGTTEQWNIINLTEDNHPLHIHLSAFQVLSETKLKDTEKLRSCLLKNKNQLKECSLERFIDKKKSPNKPPKNEAGWKNVYKFKPSYMTSMLIRFTKIDGQLYPFDATAEPGYVYHCHILDHEDNEMMRPIKLQR